MTRRASNSSVIARIRPYLLTIAFVSAVELANLILSHFWHVEYPFFLFTWAVLFSAWIGGPAQGLFAAAVSIIGSSHFLLVSPDLNADFEARLFIFAVDCAGIVLFSSALRRYRERATSAQSQVSATEYRFRKIFESKMMGILITRFNGEILDANDFFLNMIGYEREDLVDGRLNWRDLTPVEFHPRSEDIIKKTSTAGAIPPFEKEYLCKDGTRVPVLIALTRLNADVTIAFVANISERKKAERALAEAYSQLEARVAERTEELLQTADRLRQSQDFLDSVIENIPNMVFVKDAKDLRFVRFNRAGEDLLGYSREHLFGKNDFDFFSKEEAEFFTAKDRAVLEGKTVIDIPEEPLSTRFGVRFLHTKKIPILDKDGNPQYLLGISEDVTQRKASEQQRLNLLREQAARAEAEKSAEHLRFLSDVSAALNESLDPKTMLESFAKAVIGHFADWCMIDLINPDESTIQGIILAHRDQQKVKWVEEYRRRNPVDWNSPTMSSRVIRTGQPELHPLISDAEIDASITDADAREAIKAMGLRSSLAIPLQLYGRTLGSLMLVSAESGRIYSDLDLSIAMDIGKRAAYAIENARLFAKAQEASQAKSAFLANMSHEIRTPLGAILGFTQLLADHPVDEEQGRYLSTILKNGQQLLRIVDEILDLSKVESGAIHVEKIDFSLPHLLDEVMSLMRIQAESKHLDFGVKFSGPIPTRIVSDPTRLRQIFINVIGNAIKFTSCGRINVSISIQPKDQAETRHHILQVVVEDTGIGISKDQEDRLFRPFVQADSSMTRRFGGTGLGLFLSRRLARLLGGDVILSQSDLHQGSRFVITVEVQTKMEAASGATPDNREMAHEPSESVSNGRILVVDDAPDNRVLICHYVNRLGYSTDVAETGLEAVEKAFRQNFDVVLMDVQMPEMDGFEAVRALRSKHYKKPIVALTAHAMKGDRERCLEAGFDDYLGKPIDRGALNECLRRYVQPAIYDPAHSPSTGPADSSSHL